MKLIVELEENDRQAVLLALAKLTHSRPGWYPALELIAQKLRGEAMYRDFLKRGPDLPPSGTAFPTFEPPTQEIGS